MKARLIAYYLPQYHPILENDEWWGKGFTDWRTVANAKPLFLGHYQPHIPADLGFYDLRLPEARIAQAQMAREHGIEGFCYWHYWLGGGKLLLERPFEQVLKSGEPGFPFCVAWANHPWKGVWFGAGERTLIEQTYPGPKDHEEHFQYLLHAFTDDRYLTVDGKPILAIHRPRDIPEVKRFTDLWRELAHEAGLKGLHLVGEGLRPGRCEEFGFDASTYSYHRRVEWALPQNGLARRMVNLYRQIRRKPAVYSYRQAIPYFLRDGNIDDDDYPSIVPNWDNTPRFGWRGVVLHDATPELFRVHVKQVLQGVAHKDLDRRIVFIKSWNEWAEGNYLEPDLRYGRAHLEVTRDENYVD